MAFKIDLRVAVAGWKSRWINNPDIKPVQLVAGIKLERKLTPNESMFAPTNARDGVLQKSFGDILLRSPSRRLPLVPLHLRAPSEFHPRLRLSTGVGQDLNA